jgi:IS30 family transposase
MSGKQADRTTHALQLVADGTTPYRAARTVGIALSTIYRALRRAEDAQAAADDDVVFEEDAAADEAQRRALAARANSTPEHRNRDAIARVGAQVQARLQAAGLLKPGA